MRFQDHEDLLTPDERSSLDNLFPSGAAPMWGLTPGKGGSNKHTIEAFDVDDAVFFYSDRALFAGGTVAYRFRNPSLAERLWGRDKHDLTWEHMYAISGLRGVRIPFSEISPLLGWKPNAVVQPALVIKEEVADVLAEAWTLDVRTQPRAAAGPDAGGAPVLEPVAVTFTALAHIRW
ncbi:hypothetical protein BCD48_13690 [Pseudofrankia sp. BMG5.36]|nr:hypothetical protein BCD48_13690 [Pseudofrankia sp. BMG5.36]